MRRYCFELRGFDESGRDLGRAIFRIFGRKAKKRWRKMAVRVYGQGQWKFVKRAIDVSGADVLCPTLIQHPRRKSTFRVKR